MVEASSIPNAYETSVVKGIPLREEPGLGVLTLPGFLHEVTTRFGDREALVLHTPTGAVRWTYAMLWEQAMDVARALHCCGAGKNSRVGVLMTNRPEWISAFFGVGLAGGVAVPLSTFSTPLELEYLLQASGVAILLFERQAARKDFVEMLHGLEPEIRSSTPGGLMSLRFPFLRRLTVVGECPESGAIEGWSNFLAHGKATSAALVAATADTVTPADAGALFLSSGSTNRPKGILSSHRGVSIQCWRWRRILGLGDDVRCWTANGFIWSGNFGIALGATLAAGGTLVLQRIFDPIEALDLMQEERVTLPHAWPHQWAQLAAAPNWKTANLESLRHVDPSRPVAQHPTFSGSQWIEPRWTYGNTETFTISSAYPANTPIEIAGASNGEALPGNTIKILDPGTGASVPRGEHGEIAVKGPTLMMGYIGVPLDETLDDEGFFRTGDAGYLDEQGRLYFEGRLSDIIKTGGANVSPAEIEAILAAYPGVKICKAVGIPHDTLGEEVIACVVPHSGFLLEEGAIRDFLKSRLASYKVPRRMLHLREDELSLTGSAKIRSNALRELVVRRFAADTARASGSESGSP